LDFYHYFYHFDYDFYFDYFLSGLPLDGHIPTPDHVMSDHKKRLFLLLKTLAMDTTLCHGWLASINKTCPWAALSGLSGGGPGGLEMVPGFQLWSSKNGRSGGAL
jgi:hypothetical protein